MEVITKTDLTFLSELTSRKFLYNSMSSNSTDDEQLRFKMIKGKLKSVAEKFNEKFRLLYGPFDVSVSSGNPIIIGKEKLNRVWASISKGAENKQYSAQISFVLNVEKKCLDVGFYFGRASGHMLDSITKKRFEGQLTELGKILSNEISTDIELKNIYNSLFDFGFKASIFDKIVTPEEWVKFISNKPSSCQIVYSLYPNQNDEIESATIDLYVSMIMYLMNPIPSFDNGEKQFNKREYKPLTPGQRAKQAERRTLIGDAGEMFVLKYEIERLSKFEKAPSKYPINKASESMDNYYDILSLDDGLKEIFIEVKTTTRLKLDKASKSFFISYREYEFYKSNRTNYRLYRVYDIEGKPELEILDMDSIQITPDTYKAQIN